MPEERIGHVRGLLVDAGRTKMDMLPDHERRRRGWRHGHARQKISPILRSRLFQLWGLQLLVLIFFVRWLGTHRFDQADQRRLWWFIPGLVLHGPLFSKTFVQFNLRLPIITWRIT